MSKALQIIIIMIISGIVGAILTIGASKKWPIISKQPKPQIYKMQFGATINKFIVLGGRLHLVVPLSVTGESGKIIEIDKVSRKGRGK